MRHIPKSCGSSFSPARIWRCGGTVLVVIVGERDDPVVKTHDHLCASKTITRVDKDVERNDPGVERRITKNDAAAVRWAVSRGVVCGIFSRADSQNVTQSERKDCASSFFLFLSPLVIIKKKRGIGREKGETEGASLKFGGRFKRSFSCVDSLRSV